MKSGRNMRRKFAGILAGIALSMALGTAALEAGPVAGKPGQDELKIVENGHTSAVIVVSPEAGEKVTNGEGKKANTSIHRAWERRAADDLAHYIEMMSGARPAIADTEETITAALKGNAPVLLVGQVALEVAPELTAELAKVAKKAPSIRADAIVVRRVANRVYMAGLTDDGHYHAVAYLLQQWGCRWYMPTEFGECIPEQNSLSVGDLDYAYASPFEVRDGRPLHMMAWLGSSKGWGDFGARNFKTVDIPGYGGPDPKRGLPGAGHSLGKYLQGNIAEGKNKFNTPLADPEVIQHIADQVEEAYSKGENIDLGINDGAYFPSGSERDAQLQAGVWDKYFINVSMSDVFMTLYNGVADRLAAKYPRSPSKFGFFIYTNLTIPPQQVQRAAKSLYGVLAPIDIDPIHGMDSPLSPPKQEYREMMYRWAKLLEGRIYVYDYDQGMLVWRDMPNPSHMAFRQDVKHYAKAGLLGFTTESRGAFATIFTNMYFRAQLMWNPDFDVDAALVELYPTFYGPAAEPMERYWTAIYKAWEETIVTEHEFFVAPAIYTEELIERLRPEIAAAEKVVAPLAEKTERSRNEDLYLQRVEFTRHSFDIIDNYMGMVRAAAQECDYAKAADLGRAAMAARARLGEMNEIFISIKMGEKSPAWFAGEVKMDDELAAFTDGAKGTLIAKLPRDMAFMRDPNDSGLPMGVAYKDADLSYWQAHGKEFTGHGRKDYPIMTWEMVRTDMYPQAQGILHPDGQSYTGYSWYKTEVDLTGQELTGKVHIRFPGIFAKAWLYVNGTLVEFRDQNEMWWRNNYAFAWDVDVTAHLRPGRNDITVRNYNNHHVSGIFRRPFIYQETK